MTEEMTAPPRESPYTGDRVPEERRQMVVDLLSRGTPYTVVAEELMMDHRTVKAIALAACPDIIQAKANLQRQAYVAATASLDSAIDRSMNGKGTMLDAKLAVDVLMALHGEASIIVQHDHVFPQLDAFHPARNFPESPNVDAPAHEAEIVHLPADTTLERIEGENASLSPADPA